MQNNGSKGRKNDLSRTSHSSHDELYRQRLAHRVAANTPWASQDWVTSETDKELLERAQNMIKQGDNYSQMTSTEETGAQNCGQDTRGSVKNRTWQSNGQLPWITVKPDHKRKYEEQGKPHNGNKWSKY